MDDGPRGVKATAGIRTDQRGDHQQNGPASVANLRLRLCPVGLIRASDLGMKLRSALLHVIGALLVLFNVQR